MQPWRLLLLPLLLVMPTGNAALDVDRDRSAVQQQTLDVDRGSSAVQQQAPASNLCALLQSNICATELAVPTGYVVRSCGKNVTCGITITTAVSKPCSDADAAQMLELQHTLGTACMCAAKLEGVQAKAPSLMQQGTLNVKNPFHGVCNEVLMGATAAAFCVTGVAGARARAASQGVLDALANQKPLKPLAGIQEFLIITAPAVDSAKWQQLGEAARSCPLVVTAATADSADANSTSSSSSSTAAQSVPAGCEDLVSLFAAFAGPSLQSLVPLVGDAMTSFLSFLTEAREAALDIAEQLKPLLLPDSWQAFLASAAAAAADLYCAAPETCFSGQLSQLWASLQQVPAALDGQHAALQSLQRLAALAEDALPQAQQVKCAGMRKQATDSQGLQAYVFAALLRASARQQLSAASAINSSGAAQSVMTPEEVLQVGPRLLPMMMVELAGLTHLQDLEGPIRALRGQAAIVKQDVESALEEYADRAQSALKDIAALKYMLLAQLPSGSDDSTNSNTSRPAPPPAGSSVLSSEDVAGALDILKTWLDLLRKDPSLMQQGATRVKDELMPQLWGGIDKLFAEAGSGLDSHEPWLFRSGLLTYNRQARLQGTLPCIKGRARKCFSHRAGQRTFSACMSYPRVAANCLAGQVVQIPNEFLPWVAVHAGLIPALNQAHDAITPYWRPSNQTDECT